jgi:hypothetical protein
MPAAKMPKSSDTSSTHFVPEKHAVGLAVVRIFCAVATPIPVWFGVGGSGQITGARMMSDANSQPLPNSSPPVAGTEPTNALVLTQAQLGCRLLAAGQSLYERYLVEHLAPRYTKVDRPTRAEQICRLARLADPQAFRALALIWKEALKAAKVDRSGAECPYPADSGMTPSRLALELAAFDPIEQLKRGLLRKPNGKLLGGVAGMYRQRINRFIDSGKAFGLLEIRCIETGAAKGRRVKLLVGTEELHKMMVVVGANAAKLPDRLQGGDAQSGYPDADSNR